MDVVCRIVELSFSNVEMEEGLSDFVQAKILENIHLKLDFKIDKIISRA